MSNEHEQHRLDRELNDILNRSSIFDLLAATIRVTRKRGYGPVADKLQCVHDSLTRIPPS